MDSTRSITARQIKALAVALVCSILPFGIPAIAAQDPASPTAKIQGTVTVAGSREPIGGAKIQSEIYQRSMGPLVTADSNGRFEIPDLELGEGRTYRLIVSAPGYLEATPVHELANGETKTVNVALTPLASVSGRIVDREGRPLAGILAQALRLKYTEFGAKTIELGGETRTDDQGAYRIYWLRPETYYVLAGNWASPNDGATLNYVPGLSVTPTFFPDAPATYPDAPQLSNARPVLLKAGAEVAGIDVVLDRIVPRRIRGHVIDEQSGLGLHDLVVSLLVYSAGSTSPGLGNGAIVDPLTGAFDIQNAGSDSQILLVWRRPSVSIGRVSVPAGRADIDEFVVPIVKPQVIRGRVTFEGDPDRWTPAVSLEPLQAPGTMFTTWSEQKSTKVLKTEVLKDGTFTIEAFPGQYRVIVNERAYLKQARFGPVDAVNQPITVTTEQGQSLDVVISFNTAHLRGRVVNNNLRHVESAQIILMPDRQRDRVDLYRSVEADPFGRFDFPLPPGDYNVFAFAPEESNPYFDPAFVQALERDGRGTAVHLEESSKTEIELKVAP